MRFVDLGFERTYDEMQPSGEFFDELFDLINGKPVLTLYKTSAIKG